jgi:hypothetical protein
MGNGALALPAQPFGLGSTPLAGNSPSRTNPAILQRAETPAASAQVLFQGFREQWGFREQIERASVLLSLQSGNTGGPAASSRQLEFSFVQEMRESALVQFQSRTQRVANGLPTTTRTTFAEASREVAVRFSMSMRVSETVLNGFANASEAAAGDPAGIDRLLALNKEFMAMADALLNRMFEMLQDFMGGKGSFSDRVNRFLDAFQRLDFGGIFAGFSGAGARSIGIQLEFEFMMTERTTVAVQEADPIVLDLTGNGIQLTSYRDGARFDITGDGRKEQTAFVTGGDAFLAIDRNGNGIIDDGTELFGDQRGAANGFEELRKLDTNGDGIIDERDADFDKLLLWIDNGNGITEPGELVSLREAGIQSIDLNYRNVDQPAMGGNRLTQIASFTRIDGTIGKAADAMLNYTV